MSDELDRLTRAFQAADVLAQQGDERAKADATMFAREIRRLQSAGPEQGAVARTMNVVNEGIARGLGAPVDLVAGGLNWLGMDIQNPVGGSQSIRQGMNMVGAEPINRDPETRAERMLMGGGEGLGMLLPVGAVAQGMQRLGPVASAVGSAITRPFTSTPVRAVAAETLAGAGAREGEYIAGEMSDGNALARTGGALLGGFAGAVGPGLAARTASRAVQAAPVAGSMIRGARAAIVPFTEAGATVRASDRLRGLVTDPEASARGLQDAPISELTPAQQLNDPNLLALEQAAARSDPRLRDELADRATRSSDTLRTEMDAPRNGATVNDARRFFEQRRESFRNTLGAQLIAAERRAADRAARLDPARRETDNSTIVMEEIEQAYQVALTREGSLWAAVPKDEIVPTVSSRQAFNDLVAETGQALRGDIPADAQRLLGEDGFGTTETVREMHALYSRMRQISREAKSGPAPNANRARIANGIADAILQDLGATAGSMTTAGRAINSARAYSREMNEIFNQGTVGNLTAQQRSGGASVAPEVALSRAVGVGGPRAAVAVNDIRRAGGEGTMPPIEDLLRGRLTDRALPDGSIRPSSADGFIRANRETLQQFPELMGDIGASQIAARQAGTRATRVTDILKTLDNPRENVTAAFLNANEGTEIAQAVFRARNPGSAANSLRQAAARDSSGRAMDGLKSGFLDHLTAVSRGEFDSAGRPVVRGDDLFGTLQDPRARSALAQVFEPAELSRMDRIAREFQGLQGARETRALDSVIDDAPNTVISLLGRTIAARQGARAGAGVSGASLLTASFASRRMQIILTRLTNDRAEALVKDAILDRELFSALMTRQTTPAARQATERRLVEWMIGVGAVTASEMAQDQQTTSAR